MNLNGPQHKMSLLNKKPHWIFLLLKTLEIHYINHCEVS